MPSDPRTRAALDALEPSREAFRSSLATGVEALRSAVGQALESEEDAALRSARELGPFAAGRLDATRFAAVVSPRRATLPEGALAWMRRALGVLLDAAAAASEPRFVTVATGDDLHEAVGSALARLGRAFGAARVAEGARTGTMDEAAREPALEAYPFRRWSPRERGIAPPLVVEVAGGDLTAAGLGDFLDGGLKLALVVRGAAPPAPLARLVTPGTYVAQAFDAGAVAAMAARPGPAVVAVFEPSSGAVAFVHDPETGRSPWERIRTDAEPDDLRRLLEEGRGRWRARGWARELEHLIILATPPAAAAAGQEPEADGLEDPADRLAAWLLARSDLDAAPRGPAPTGA